MADVAIITAIYDGYDALKPPLEQDDVTVEWVLVTDALPARAEGYRVVHQPMPSLHPNRAAKRPKMLPWLYTDAPVSIWIDASFRVVSRRFAFDMVNALLDNPSPLAQFGHPARNCIFTEAAESARLAKYDPKEIALQAEAYRAHGHPHGWGLWATGLIVRNHDNGLVHALGESWLKECMTRSFQDQLSEPFVLRELGLRPTTLPFSHWSNPWVVYEASARHGSG